MSRKSLIGLNAEFRSAKKDSPAFSYLSAGYYDAIVASGGVPVIVPPLKEDDDLERILDLLDGMVLIGGADLDPRRDGFMLHPAVRTMEPRREDFDRRLMRMIAARRMPVFGIGVGMQLLNVSQGGNLFLHVPEDMPRAAAQGPARLGPSPRAGGRARFADGAGVWRRRNPRQQPAPHGDRRSGARLPGHGPLSRRRG